MTPYRFLVLLKPEANRPEVDRTAFLQLVSDHFAAHGVEVIDRRDLTGAWMRDERALDWIYPRLSVVAQAGEGALTSFERDILRRESDGVARCSADEACAEFGRSSIELCLEGDGARVVKLGPGAYAADMPARGRVVLNHFFPEFRDRFYADDAVVVAFECQTCARGLHELRDSLVGYIDPTRAAAGSLRAAALVLADRLRLREVSVARNFFHISPGYVEAMMQLAFLFAAGGSFGERLERAGLVLNARGLEKCQDRLSLSRLFAQAEQLPLSEALGALQSWVDA